MGRPAGSYISNEELETIMGPYARVLWSKVLGLAVTTIDKWFHRNRIQPKHKAALEAVSRVLRSEPTGTLEDLLLDGPLRGLFEVELAGCLHRSGITNLAKGGYIDPRGAVPAISEDEVARSTLEEYSDQELTRELEQRGWEVHLSLKSSDD